MDGLDIILPGTILRGAITMPAPPPPMVFNPSWLGGGVHLPPMTPREPQMSVEEYRRRYPTACESCIAARRGRYCLDADTVSLIGPQCDRAQVQIAGVDFRALVERVAALERYVIQCEVERQTPLPNEIAVTIATYF